MPSRISSCSPLRTASRHTMYAILLLSTLMNMRCRENPPPPESRASHSARTTDAGGRTNSGGAEAICRTIEKDDIFPDVRQVVPPGGNQRPQEPVRRRRPLRDSVPAEHAPGPGMVLPRNKPDPDGDHCPCRAPRRFLALCNG